MHYVEEDSSMAERAVGRIANYTGLRANEGMMILVSTVHCRREWGAGILLLSKEKMSSTV